MNRTKYLITYNDGICATYYAGTMNEALILAKDLFKLYFGNGRWYTGISLTNAKFLLLD